MFSVRIGAGVTYVRQVFAFNFVFEKTHRSLPAGVVVCTGFWRGALGFFIYLQLRLRVFEVCIFLVSAWLVWWGEWFILWRVSFSGCWKATKMVGFRKLRHASEVEDFSGKDNKEVMRHFWMRTSRWMSISCQHWLLESLKLERESGRRTSYMMKGMSDQAY